MRASLLTLLLVLGLAPAALAQAPDTSAPDETWNAYPGPPTPQPSEPLPPLNLGPPPPKPRVPKPPPTPNVTSLYATRVLEPGRWALGGMLGFPFASVRASVGLLPGLDGGLSVDTLYGVMTNLHVQARLSLLRGSNWSLSGAFEGGYALFLHGALEEEHGARYLTGRRNWNLLPGLVAAYQGDAPRATRFFLDVRYALAFDTEPFARTPLGGVPPGVRVGGNVPVRLGVEVPFSERTSYVIMLGGDLHGFAEDSAFMPAIGVGLITGL